MRGQQAVYYNGQTGDLAIVAVVAFVCAAILGVAAFFLLGAIGFFRLILAIFVGPAAGGLVAEAVRRSVGRRRTRGMNWVAVGATIAGMLIGTLVLMLLPYLLRGASLSIVFSALPLILSRWDMLIFAGLGASTVYARLQ